MFRSCRNIPRAFHWVTQQIRRVRQAWLLGRRCVAALDDLQYTEAGKIRPFG